MFQLKRTRTAEEFDIARIRTGPAAFDILNAEFVKALDNFQFILNGETDAFALRPVAKRGIVY
jgi:hypothetical protein